MLAAVIKAVDDFQDLLRISAATPGNDYRLGGDEAPPAIISIFLGEELEAIVDSVIEGEHYSKKGAKYMNFGVSAMPAIRRDNTDRNRTSPFAFTGNKFEFRMVGSSQNIALSNIVLNTAVAKSLKEFADILEAAKDFDKELDKLLAATFKAHKRILFSGNSYSAEWEKEAAERGLFNFKTAPDAYEHFTDDKNIELFTSFGVMSEIEMRSRREIFFENYRKVKNIEAKTMLEMVARDIIPAVSAYVGKLADAVNAKRMVSKNIDTGCECDIIEKLSTLLSKTYDAYSALEKAEKTAISKKDEAAAIYYRNTVESKMQNLRKLVDEMEVLTAREAWPMPTYGDIIFKV